MRPIRMTYGCRKEVVIEEWLCFAGKFWWIESTTQQAIASVIAHALSWKDDRGLIEQLIKIILMGILLKKLQGRW